jgi:mono/diheme cytochrome c family protein
MIAQRMKSAATLAPMGRYFSALTGLLLVVVLVAAVGAGARPAATDQSAAAVTFSEHVAPILFKNCASCHRPGQAGPFSVLTYETVRENGGEIAEATRERYMPPWKPAPADYPLLGERRLTDIEIDTIQRWVKGGMAQGDPRKLPAPPVFNDEWRLGKPDLVVTMSEAFTVPADGRDVYRNFVVPLNLNEDRWLKVIDYRPSARPVVHHAILSLDPSGQARQLDAADPGPGFGGVMGTGGLAGRGGLQDMVARARGKSAEVMPRPARGAGAVGGWAPGGTPRPLRDDLAFFVPKGADLIVSTHFPSQRPGRRGTVDVRALLREASTGEWFRRDPATACVRCIQGHQHPTGQRQLRHHRLVRDPGGGSRIRGWRARALSREGPVADGHVPERHQEGAAAYSGLGSELAGDVRIQRLR